MPNTSQAQQDAQALLKRQREKAATTLPCQWGDDPLITAVKRGQARKALRVLERRWETQGLDPVKAILTPNAEGRNLLHLAIEYGQPQVLQSLEERSATQVSAVSVQHSLLMLAMDRRVHGRGYHTRQLAMVQVLLERGERPLEGTAPAPWINWLMSKRQFAAIDLFLELPCARDWRWDVPIFVLGGVDRATAPLAQLLVQGHVERFNKALAAGAPLKWSGEVEVSSVLHLAITTVGLDDEVIPALLTRDPSLIGETDATGGNALHVAVRTLMWNNGRWARRIAMFQTLLDHARLEDVNALDANAQTPVMALIAHTLNFLSSDLGHARDVLERLTRVGARLLAHMPGKPDVHELLNDSCVPLSMPVYQAWMKDLRSMVVAEEAQLLRATLPGNVSLSPSILSRQRL